MVKKLLLKKWESGCLEKRDNKKQNKNSAYLFVYCRHFKKNLWITLIAFQVKRL